MRLVCSECSRVLVPRTTMYVAGYGVLLIAGSSQKPFVPPHEPLKSRPQALPLEVVGAKVVVINKLCVGSLRQPSSLSL